MNSVATFKHVKYAWDDAQASKMSPLERLIYRSNLLGSDTRITNTAGGNTSSILDEVDPLSGEPVEVFWVKGSGGDLRTALRENFASLEQQKLVDMQAIYLASKERGPKTPVEDAMVARFPLATFNLNPRAASIDTPLLSFVPHRHVDHLHPNAVISLAACKEGERLTREIYGEEVLWSPWQRPGFDLGLRLQETCAKNPKVRGMVMENHGSISWADEDKACYDWTLEMIEKAARYIESKDRGEKTFGGQKYQDLPEARRQELLCDILPWLRGQVSKNRRFVGTMDYSATMMRFINSADAPRLAALGTSCPDHFLRTKIWPLYVAWDPQNEGLPELRAKLGSGLEAYRKNYAAYYERCKRPNSPAMRDSNPTVILIPGLGLIAWGKTKSESRVTAEFYGCAVEVMRGAEALGGYVALPEQEAFDVEYWLLEEAKLKRMPPEREFMRKIVAVLGAASGIGKSLALRLAKEGAHVVCVDLNLEQAQAAAEEVGKIQGQGIGVAGSGLSACGPTLGLACDISNRESLSAMFRQILLAYGGLDQIAVTAGIFVPPDASGRISDQQWDRTFAVNVKGPFLIADEARRIFEAQAMGGAVVITTSVNAVVSKKGSMAYDTSKAAANHLVRELAVELAPVRVNGLAPAAVVQGSTLFPRDRVISSLRKYSLRAEDSEDTEVLTQRLAEFYASRTLLKSPVTPQDQADVAFFLLSDASSKTTGQVIHCDGGLADAFLR